MIRCLALLVVSGLLASCSPAPKPQPKKPPRSMEPRVSATLPLSGQAGIVHVIEIPSGVIDVTRCVVATSSSGHISTACSPPEIK